MSTGERFRSVYRREGSGGRLVKLYRAWPRLDTAVDPDAYLRRIVVNTHQSLWRAEFDPSRVNETTLSAVSAPSAFAQVTHAAAGRGASYLVRSVEKIVTVGGLRSKPWATAYGEFDPVHKVGEQTDNLGAQIRYVGGSRYVFLTDDLRGAYSAGGLCGARLGCGPPGNDMDVAALLLGRHQRGGDAVQAGFGGVARRGWGA